MDILTSVHLGKRLHSQTCMLHFSAKHHTTEVYCANRRLPLVPEQYPESRHVRAVPWPSGRWRARRRIDTGQAGRLHSRKRARGHVQPRCRGGGNVWRRKWCRRCHRSGCGPPASRDADGRGRLSAAQRTCARRAGRPTLRTGGPVGRTAARWGLYPRRYMASGTPDELPQQKPARRQDHPRVIVGASDPGSHCARSPRATWGGAGGQGGRCRPGPVTLVAEQSFSTT